MSSHDREKARYETFLKELEKLSFKYGVVIGMAAAVTTIIEDGLKKLERVEYKGDFESPFLDAKKGFVIKSSNKSRSEIS